MFVEALTADNVIPDAVGKERSELDIQVNKKRRRTGKQNSGSSKRQRKEIDSSLASEGIFWLFCEELEKILNQVFYQLIQVIFVSHQLPQILMKMRMKKP